MSMAMHPVRVLEDELRELAHTQIVRTPALNIINNTLTAAHGDTIKVLHAMRDECHALVARVDKLVDEHEAMLESKGQSMAHVLESAMQELKRSVAWFEEQTPRLENPKLEAPALPKPDAVSSAVP